MVSALGAADVSKIDLTTSYDAGKYFNYATPDLSVSMYAYSSGTYTPLQNLPRNTYEIYSREGMISTPVSVTFFLTPGFNATFSNTEDFVELAKTKVRITGNQNLFVITSYSIHYTKLYDVHTTGAGLQGHMIAQNDQRNNFV